MTAAQVHRFSIWLSAALALATARARASTRLRTFVLLLPIAALGVLWPLGAWATPFDLNGNDWEGCAELVRLARAELGMPHVVTASRLDFRELRPEDGLLLLYPERGLDTEELAKFMHAGGRVVLLDDFGRGDALLRHFGMERVPGPHKPAEYLRHNPQFALAEPASAHPVVTDVNRVVTNHATGLTHPDLSPVLKIRGDGEPDVVIAVAGAVGQGRLLAVGDPSIVMNSMLRYGGNKNFARGLLRYGVERDGQPRDPSGKQGGKLYIAAGDFDQKGHFGGEENAWDDSVRALREALETVRRDGAPANVAWYFAIAVGLSFLVWLASRAGRLHKPIAPRFVRSIPAVAQGGVSGHAAVIAAPQTSRVLAVLELKSALEEQLTSILALPKVPPQAELLARVETERLLDSEGVRSLRQLLLRMSNVETMIVFQRSGGMVQPVRDNEVVSIAKSVRDLVNAAKANADARGMRARTGAHE